MKVTKMFKLKLTQPQIDRVEQILNGLRGLYNLYLEKNEEVYEVFDKFLTTYDFMYMIRHDWKPFYPWVEDIPASAKVSCVMAAERVYKNFFNGKSNKPVFRSKRRNPIKSFYFPKTGVREVSDRVIWIPILHEVKICEKDYFNPNDEISSGRIVKKADGYYLAFCIRCKNPKVLKNTPRNNPIGIDVGIKTYAAISDGNEHVKVSNPNNRENVKCIESKIKSLQRVISKKYVVHKKKGVPATEIYHSKNIDKIQHRINKLRQRLNNIRTDFINKLVYMLVARTKPEYICIENLNIRGMLRKSYHRLADRIAKCKWYYFSKHLAFKCKQFDVELRIANKLFASSKTCSECGHKKDKMKLTERTYVCKHCGLTIDRDINAAINLLKTTDYKLAN